MMRIIAPNISGRIIAGLCLATGLAGYWFSDSNAGPETRFLVQPYVFSPFVDTEPEKVRNISEYDNGGIVDACFYSDTPRKGMSRIEHARDFILASWKDKRKSYIVIPPSIAHAKQDEIFIEPDSGGDWHILIWHGSRRFLEPPGQRIATEIESRPATVTELGYQFYRPGSRILVFLNKSGETVLTF